MVNRGVGPSWLGILNFLIGALVVAALYFTREILVPIAVAVLLSFVLSPLVRAFQRMKVPRSIAVLSAVSLALAIALSLAAMVTIEVNQLASDLPRYQSTLGEKSTICGTGLAALACSRTPPAY